MTVSKNIEKIVEQQIALEKEVASILDDAAYAERFLRTPNNNRCPSMYQALETYYDKKDWGFHVEPKMILRSTPRQMTRYSMAIDILLEIKKDISDNPARDRQLLWLRANRFKWTRLGKHFGFDRRKIKIMYEIVLEKLCNKLKNNLAIYDKIFI